MQRRFSCRWIAACAALTTALAAPALARGQTVNGQARVVEARVVELTGTATTVLADTGTLTDASDARDTSQADGSVPGLLRGGTLHAATLGWPDEVASEASIADLAVTVAGTTIGAGFVMSRVRAVQGATPAASAEISGLSINGVPVTVTGAANQTLAIPGGRLVINEQETTSGGTRVTALHVVVDGIADVTIASASAGIR